MFNFSNLQIPPPKIWQDFESLCKDLWEDIWKDPQTKKHGRNGQAQQGVDVYGRPNGKSNWAGVQCKGKDNYTDKRLTEDELKSEVAKAKGFEPPLTKFTLATTGPRDSKLQELARTITADHIAQGLFTVDVVAWEDVVELLENHSRVMEKYYPQFTATLSTTKDIEGFSKNVKDIIGVDLSNSICDQIKKETGSLRSLLLKQQQVLKADPALDDNSILQVLSRIEHALSTKSTNSKAKDHTVEIIPADKLQTLGLIATSLFNRAIASYKMFFSDVPWERDVRYLKRKKVVESKKGVLETPCQITRNVLSSEETKISLHKTWLDALQPLKTHVDVAMEVSWHYLQLGEHWKSAEVFIEFAHWGMSHQWESVYCDCLLAYKHKAILKKFTQGQRIQYLDACIQYLLRCNRNEEALSICSELRSLSKRHNSTWGVVESYLNAAEANEALGNETKALRCMECAIEVADANNDKSALASAKHRLAIHLDTNSPEEALRLLAECVELRQALGDQQGVIDALNSSGVVCLNHEDPAAAFKFFHNAAKNARGAGYIHGESFAKLNLGICEYEKDEFTNALKLLRESRQIAEPKRYLNNVADTFDYEGIVLYRMNKFFAAQRVFEKSYEIREQNEQWDDALSTLNNIGAMLLFRKKENEGRKKLKEAYKIAVTHQDEYWAYKSQLNIAMSFMECNSDAKSAIKYLLKAARTEEARSAYSSAGKLWQDRLFLLIEHDGRRIDLENTYARAMRCFQREKDWKSIVHLHEGEFCVYHNKVNDSESAINTLLKLIALAEKKKDLETRGRAQAQLSVCYMEQGRLEEAEGPLLKSLNDGRKCKYSNFHVFLANAGEYYSRIGSTKKATQYFAKATKQAITNGDYDSAFESSRGHAFALGDASKFDESESITKEFCREMRRLGKWLPYVQGLEVLGDLSWWRNRPKTAEHQYCRALEAAKKHRTIDAEPGIRLEYAKALIHNAKAEAALLCLQESESLFEDHAFECRYHAALAEIFERLGNKRYERRHLRVALEKALESGDSEDIAGSASAMSDVYEEKGELDQAINTIELALDHEQGARQRIALMMQRLSLLLRLSRKRAVDRAFMDVQRFATENHFYSELVESHIWAGDFSVENGESTVSAFKHYLAANIYAYAVDEKTVGEIQAHMLHGLSLIPSSNRQRHIRRLETNCRKWLEAEVGETLGQAKITGLLMPFRVAQRFNLLKTDWRQVADEEFDRIIAEELLSDAPGTTHNLDSP